MKDENESFKWFLKASKSGDKNSIYNVAVFYTNGFSVSIER